MKPVNKKQQHCEALPHPPEAIPEIEELRTRLAGRDLLISQLEAQVSERDERIANLEGALSGMVHEDEESSVRNDIDDESRVILAAGMKSLWGCYSLFDGGQGQLR